MVEYEKLSITQKRVLRKMEGNLRYTAYSLVCSIATLRALEKRGWVELIKPEDGLLGILQEFHPYRRIVDLPDEV